MANIRIPVDASTAPSTYENTPEPTPEPVITHTPAEMLREVNNAIYNIMVGGQAYTLGTRSLTRANLSELKKLKGQLEAEAMMDGTKPSDLFGDTYVAVFSGR